MGCLGGETGAGRGFEAEVRTAGRLWDRSDVVEFVDLEVDRDVRRFCDEAERAEDGRSVAFCSSNCRS